MDTPLAVTEQEVQQLLHEVAFTKHYGFGVRAIGRGTCTLYVPFHDALERPGGMVGGHAFMVAADVSMWLALMTHLGRADTSVTIELTTAFLQGARREDFYCNAQILKLGKRLVYGVAECVNLQGTRLTHHTVTYARSTPEDKTS